MRNAQPSKGSTHSPLPGIRWIRLDAIDTRHQVRSSMDKQALQELADDIQAHGLLQPLILRPNGERYIVIAGHRRRVACEMAGLVHVPAIVGEADADRVLELQLAENLQREDLDDQDIGKQLSALYAKHQSLDTVALLVNKSKSWVAKRIKLAGEDRLYWIARDLFDSGATEDLEIILGVQRLAELDHGMAEQIAAQVKAGKATRESVRQAIAAARSKHAAKASPGRRTTKPAKPRRRKLRDMCSELLYEDAAPTNVIEAWEQSEQAEFWRYVEAAWDAGRKMPRTAAALVASRIEREDDVIALARMHGFLCANEKTAWADVKDDYLRQVDELRKRFDYEAENTDQDQA